MDVVYRRCCGLDVHKQSVIACLLLLDEAGRSANDFARPDPFLASQVVHDTRRIVCLEEKLSWITARQRSRDGHEIVAARHVRFD
jgi:hypothetical protein